MKQSALFIALLPLLITPAIYAETTQTSVLDNRAAKGDITQPGGARRLSEDQTAAIRASLNEKPAKNIILLIGDGMGDSEITAARNYAEGAGGFFKGIDALPLTGQYTHYALDKKTGKPDYVTDSAASATAWSTGVKTYNGALAWIFTKKIVKPFWRWQKRRAWRPVTSPPLNFRMRRLRRWWHT